MIIWGSHCLAEVIFENWELDIMMPILPSLVALAVVIMTTVNVSSDDKIGILVTLSFHWVTTELSLLFFRGVSLTLVTVTILLQWTCPTNPTMHQSNIPQCTICNRNVHLCAHFCYKMVHCGIYAWCIVGFVRWVNTNGALLKDMHEIRLPNHNKT